jgi:alginate O-acetyltransferase complex protein AlgI
MSLSRWLRDYLYIPLGGNRRGASRTYVNLMLVMLLGGLWHGAAWAFVAWGAWHGGLLALERWRGSG